MKPEDPGEPVAWPTWARRWATVALVVHLTAVVAGALAAVPPFSPLERAVSDVFSGYYGLIDQGYGYRFYAPAPPPTPVVTARLEFADGRPAQVVRLPDRSLRPRLLYQRHLALANALNEDFQMARRTGRASRWAASYARHLCRARGCARVALFVQFHQVPDLGQVREALTRPGARVRGVDLDAEEFYTVPERIGDFACDGF